MLEVIRPTFAALRWLAAHRFADQPHLADGIALLEGQAEQLAAMRLRKLGSWGWPAARCPGCGGKPTARSKYDPIDYCQPCLGVIMPALDRLRSWETGFGTDAI